MKYSTSLVWFRNDLRLHDNITLTQAIQDASSILAVYCLPEAISASPDSHRRIGSHRQSFLLEALIDLKQNLQKSGNDLLIVKEKSAEVLVSIAKDSHIEAIYFSQEVGTEEIEEVRLLEDLAKKEGIATHSFFQSTMYHPRDLPFAIQDIPDIFTSFRHKCEKHAVFQQPLPSPQNIVMTQTAWTSIDLSTLYRGKGSCPYLGGETEAWKRLKEYFWEKDALKTYKETRNGLLGKDYSSKFSPYLALGCISPRAIASEVLRYEQERTKNESTYWMLFELLWRDYFKFIGMKYGSGIFKKSGIQQKAIHTKKDKDLFSKWMYGETGIPFIDANMRELIHTGFMSNRGRQVVASFLINDLKLDWTWGAAYFEELLVDYDVTSNWCNWMYVAGVGNDPRPNRYFNILKQGQQYDPDGAFVRHWIPELKDLKDWDIHIPFLLPENILKAKGISLGKTYPHPVVKLE